MDFKKQIKKMIEQKENKLSELKKRSKETEDIGELRALNEDVDEIISELNELKAIYGDADRPRDEKDRKPDDDVNVDVNVDEKRNLDPLATMRMKNGAKEKRNGDVFASVEYRTAFMNHVKTGAPIPAEFRQDAITTTTDASAVIPTTILNEIVKEMSVYGNLFDEVPSFDGYCGGGYWTGISADHSHCQCMCGYGL